MNILQNKGNFALLFALSLFCLFCFNIGTSIYNTLPSFDGAMNLQVPINLIKNGKYATNYDNLTEFASRIQTGVPLLLPIALLFLIFDISSFTSQIPNAVYLLSLAFLIFLYSKKILNTWFAMLGVMMFICTPYLYTYGLGIYGEIPALFFLITAIFLFHLIEGQPQRSVLLSILTGISFGLAYLTKTVILIAVPSFFFTMLLDMLVIKRIRIKVYFLVICAAITTVLPFEIYK